MLDALKQFLASLISVLKHIIESLLGAVIGAAVTFAHYLPIGMQVAASTAAFVFSALKGYQAWVEISEKRAARRLSAASPKP